MSDFNTVLALVVIVAIYFLPTIIAMTRRHANRWPIFLVNFLFGATGLGWFGSLIWSLHAVHRGRSGWTGGESGLNIGAADYTVSQRPVPQLVAPTDEAPADVLARLKRLLDTGAISQTDYDALRQPVLDQMLKG
jgi:hypothetical protein